MRRKATFRSALDRMNDLRVHFHVLGALLYEWVENNAPGMFKEICAG